MCGMRSYIVSCSTPEGELRERHVEARNHLAAAGIVKAEGLTILSIDRDDGETRSQSRSRKRLKGVFISIVVCLILATICVAIAWHRSGHRLF